MGRRPVLLKITILLAGARFEELLNERAYVPIPGIPYGLVAQARDALNKMPLNKRRRAHAPGSQTKQLFDWFDRKFDAAGGRISAGKKPSFDAVKKQVATEFGITTRQARDCLTEYRKLKRQDVVRFVE
jgi:hypothetical protein